MRTEAMFGPIRLRVPFEKAVEHKMVLPVEVILTNVPSDIDPCAGYVDVDKERYGIWANQQRNKLIARDARLYDENTQVLIPVKTLEHALYLRKLLPEFTLVYDSKSQKEGDWRYFANEGLLGENFKILSPERRAKLTTRFENGKLKKVIATPVWNVGVNFKRLQVIVRADASGSKRLDTQIPGRAVRLFEGQKCAVLHDYLDQFNSGFERKAKKRVASYEANKWKVHRPQKDKRSLLQKIMDWDEI
jgi:superfamily II DNA or RNA helicase